MRKLIYNLPDFKGKQRILLILDKFFKTSIINGRNGIKLEGYFSSLQDTAFIKKEVENYKLEYLISNLPNDGVFIDIGANNGYYSALASQKLSREGSVLSFEPSLREYRRLIFANQSNFHQCQWLLFNIALGSENEIVRIKADESHTGINFISKNKNDGTQSCVLMKGCDIINNFIHKNKVIDLIKIDVEGYEYFVLLGLLPILKDKRVCCLQIEITDIFLKRAGSTKEMLYNLLNSLGYEGQYESDKWQYNEVFILKDTKVNVIS